MAGRPRVRVALLLTVAALLVVTGVMAVAVAGGSVPQHAAVVRDPAGVEPAALRVLREWDARRSQAYARADEAALAALYVAGSRTGAADRAVLRGYRERGLRVTGMRTQLLAVRVLTESGRRLELLATDVLVDAVAAQGRGSRWALPSDLPSTRRVVLVRRGGAWRVSEAYPVR